METLNGTSWDVLISGTGLPQSLLALALSRSGKTILHVDRNEYYGGDEAALSLSEAETWAETHAAALDETSPAAFSNARVSKAESDAAKLSHARAYSLALAPQLLYARSTLLSSLVSSRTDSQLEFQAVGSWFILNTASDGDASPPTLTRVPGGREDVFQDRALDLKAKRSLMKFLRFVAASEEQPDTWHSDRSMPFSTFLREKFALPPASHAPIFALTLSNRPLEHTTVEFAVPRIARHLSSIGVFGPGFGAVLPKWGGLAELGQVACRACAVGGGVYVLGKGIDHIRAEEGKDVAVQLSGGDEVSARWVAGALQDLPLSSSLEKPSDKRLMSKSISIISSPLTALFPPTSDGGPIPAGAVAMIPSRDDATPPVYIFAHSSESGECPVGQCVLYAAVAQPSEVGFDHLDEAVKGLLGSLSEESPPRVLWTMQYQQRFVAHPSPSPNGSILVLDPLSSDLAFEEKVLHDVKAVWEQICGSETDSGSFLKFEARDGAVDDEEGLA